MTLTGEQLRKRPRWVMPVLVVLLVLVVGVYLAYSQWTAVPAAFREAQERQAAIPEAERLELARQIEMRLPTQYSRRIEPGTDGTRELSATFEELNAWLNLRLEPYLKNQGIAWPEGLGAVLVAERDGLLVLAADVDMPGLSQIVSLYFEVVEVPAADVASTAEDSGPPAEATLAVRVARITVGNVPLPRARLANLLREELGNDARDPAVAAILTALEEDQAVPIPELQVDRVRRAAVTGLRVHPVGVTGTMRMWRKNDPIGDSAGSGVAAD